MKTGQLHLRILQELADGELTQSELAGLIRVPLSDVQMALTALERAGSIERVWGATIRAEAIWRLT